MLVNDSGLVTVVDVKPAHRMADAQVAAVFAWTERVVAARGWAFEVWHRTDARTLANFTFLAGDRLGSVVTRTCCWWPWTWLPGTPPLVGWRMR